MHPAVTSAVLPGRISSEKDSEDWILAVLLRPALAAVQAAQTGNFRTTGKFPNLTSSHGGGSGAAIPDAMLWSENWVLQASFEIKTHAAFVDSNTTGMKEPTFACLNEYWEGMPLGYGTRFVWPTEGTTGTTKADQMLTQVSASLSLLASLICP